MTDLNDVLSLSEAADQLDNQVKASTLKRQAATGALRARLVGKTWITTIEAVEEYRRDHMGKLGRPAGAKDSKPRVRRN